jgi:hypothetical protein
MDSKGRPKMKASYVLPLLMTVGLCAASATSAYAGLSFNGRSLNGVSSNGRSLNGVSFNGTRGAGDVADQKSQVTTIILKDGTHVTLR